MITINRPSHTGPWAFDKKRPLLIRYFDFLAGVGIKNYRLYSKERKGARARFDRTNSGKWCHHMAPCFRLPPGIYNWRPIATHIVVIPTPSLGINRLTNSTQQFEA